MMMMGNMGGSSSGGSMGMNMGSGAAGSMDPSMGMNMGSMPGMSGQMPVNYMPGMYDPSAMSGMANHGAAVGGTNFGGIFSGILTLTIELLALFLVIGLVVGIAVLIKRIILDGEFYAPRIKTACVNCGQHLNAGWSCCPRCGTAKAK